jgi:hypothetical protein
MNRKYDTKRWAEQTRAGRTLFIWNYFMSGTEIPGWRLIKRVPPQVYQGRKILTYLWQRAEEELIKVDTIQSTSWQGAHEALLDVLEQFQAPELPEARSRQIELGDVSYVGRGELLAAAVMACANMVAGVYSVGSRDVPVIEVARRIDEQFSARPVPSREGMVPRISEFSAERGVARVNEAIALKLGAQDPLERPMWFKLIANRGEFQVREDDQRIYFKSGEPGQIQLLLFATNENGYTAEAPLSIVVE